MIKILGSVTLTPLQWKAEKNISLLVSLTHDRESSTLENNDSPGYFRLLSV